MNKKLLLYVLAIIMSSMINIGFTSCDKDDDKVSNPLVGTWYGEDESEKDGGMRYEEISFNEDMTCTSIVYQLNPYKITFEDHGRYQIDDNVLSIWWASEKEAIEREGPYRLFFTISGDILTTQEVTMKRKAVTMTRKK